MQLGAFADAANADRLVQRVRGIGLRAFVERTVREGRSYSRVMVGPERDRQVAERALERLSRDRDHIRSDDRVRVSTPDTH